MTCDDDQREFYDVYGELEGPMGVLAVALLRAPHVDAHPR